VLFNDGSSKTPHTKILKVEKFFLGQKIEKSTKESKTGFFSRMFFLAFFWAFLGEGSSKTRLKKYREIKSNPGPFFTSNPPTRHGAPHAEKRPTTSYKQIEGKN
jgi:hypothetical protein